MLTLTDGAVEAVKGIVSSLPETAGVRISEHEAGGGEGKFQPR
jgi:hypothetical protein